jgi:hypothetical protein
MPFRRVLFFQSALGRLYEESEYSLAAFRFCERNWNFLHFFVAVARAKLSPSNRVVGARWENVPRREGDLFYTFDFKESYRGRTASGEPYRSDSDRGVAPLDGASALISARKPRTTDSAYLKDGRRLLNAFATTADLWQVGGQVLHFPIAAYFAHDERRLFPRRRESNPYRRVVQRRLNSL